jgi:hypothetical protein
MKQKPFFLGHHFDSGRSSEGLAGCLSGEAKKKNDNRFAVL